MIVCTVLMLLLFASLGFGQYCGNEPTTTLQRLKKDVLCNYESSVRPVIYHRNSTSINFHIVLKSFKMDINNDILSMDSWISANWLDEGLKWDPTQYQGIRQLHLKTNEIWTPDLSVYNRYDQGSEPKMISGATCIVSFTGVVVCVPPHHVDALCIADLTRYPFDTQNCSLRFGSWVHKGEEVDFHFKDPILDLEDLVSNGEYELVDFNAHKNPGHYKCCPNSTYPSITLSLLLTRIHGPHAATALIPSLVCIFLTLTSLWLAPDSKDRLVLCCVSVISCFFQLEYVSWAIPMKGDRIPLLVVLARDSLLLSSFTILLTVFLQNLLLKKTPPPAWISSIISFVIGCRPGQIIFLSDASVRGVASAKGEDDGTTIIDNTENATNTINTEDWRIFARMLDRLTFIYFTIQYTILMANFIP